MSEASSGKAGVCSLPSALARPWKRAASRGATSAMEMPSPDRPRAVRPHLGGRAGDGRGAGPGVQRLEDRHRL